MGLSPGHYPLFDCPMHLMRAWRLAVVMLNVANVPPGPSLTLQGFINHWLTFNEFNMILHAPLRAGLCFEEGRNIAGQPLRRLTQILLQPRYQASPRD